MGLEFFDIAADHVKDGGVVCEPPGGGGEYGSNKIVTEATMNKDLMDFEPYEKDGKKLKTSGKMVERWHNGQAWRCWRTVLRT